MDSEDKTHIIGHSEVKLLGINDSESGKPRKTQSHSLEVISNSGDGFENSAILKDISCTTEHSNNLVCETMQSERPQKPTLEDEYKGIEIGTNRDKTNEMLKGISTTVNSIDALEATTSQDNSPSSCYNKESSIPYDQNKVKRNISRSQVHADGIPMEKSDDSSDEDSSKRQKLNESTYDAENLTNNTVMFQKTDSKVKQRNYRKRRNVASDNEDSSENVLFNETVRRASVLDIDEGDCLFSFSCIKF